MAYPKDVDTGSIKRVTFVDLNGAQALLKGYNTATFAKPDVTAAGSSGAWTTANSAITLFTITGTVQVRVYGVVGATALTSTLNTGTLAVGVPGTSTTLMLGTTTVGGGAAFAIGNVWVDTAPTGAAKQLPTTASASPIIMNAGTISLTIATNNMTAGAMTLYCDWVPVSAGATVVAATP